MSADCLFLVSREMIGFVRYWEEGHREKGCHAVAGHMRCPRLFIFTAEGLRLLLENEAPRREDGDCIWEIQSLDAEDRRREN